MEEKEHEYTIECIFHFTCGECKNWWSYAREDKQLPSGKRTWKVYQYCPHCGQKSNLKKKEN